MSNRFLSVVTVLGSLLATPAYAQVDGCPAYHDSIDALVAATEAEADNAATVLVDVGRAPRCFVEFLSQHASLLDVVRQFESSRSDRQAGSSSPSTGTTTVVAAGPGAKVLSFAAEYGAITQSAKDRTITVRGNLAGLPSALVRGGVVPYCVGEGTARTCVGSPVLSALRRVSFGVSFDPSRGQTLTTGSASPAGAAAQTVTFTGSGQEVSAYNVRIEVWNQRDASSPEFTKKWAAKLQDKATRTAQIDPAVAALDSAVALAAAGDLIVAVRRLDAYSEWLARTRREVIAARQSRNRVVAVFTVALRELATQVTTLPDWEDDVRALRLAYNRFFMAQDELVDTLASANVLAVELNRERPAAQPSTTNLRVIFDYAVSARTKILTNGALTFYDAATAAAPTVERLRDAQLGVQLNHDLGNVALLGPANIGVSGYYQYQRSPSILKVDAASRLAGVTFVGLPADAKEVFTKIGDIWLGQVRLSLTPKSSSVTIPLSVTVSNRTELIDKPTWRGQVGINYNLDAFFSAIK